MPFGVGSLPTTNLRRMRWSCALLDKLGLAAEHPAIGAPRRFLGPTARILVEGRYVVIYEPTDYGVLAVAIVHGARDPETWI